MFDMFLVVIIVIQLLCTEHTLVKCGRGGLMESRSFHVTFRREIEMVVSFSDNPRRLFHRLRRIFGVLKHCAEN